jgi:hypothetical protein
MWYLFLSLCVSSLFAAEHSSPFARRRGDLSNPSEVRSPTDVRALAKRVGALHALVYGSKRRHSSEGETWANLKEMIDGVRRIEVLEEPCTPEEVVFYRPKGRTDIKWRRKSSHISEHDRRYQFIKKLVPPQMLVRRRNGTDDAWEPCQDKHTDSHYEYTRIPKVRRVERTVTVVPSVQDVLESQQNLLDALCVRVAALEEVNDITPSGRLSGVASGLVSPTGLPSINEPSEHQLPPIDAHRIKAAVNGFKRAGQGSRSRQRQGADQGLRLPKLDSLKN